MVLHLARDCKYRRKNFRFYHCFGEEDGMKHLKRPLAIFLQVLMFMPFALLAVMLIENHVHTCMHESLCVCHVCGDFLARCGTCSASQSEIPVDPLHDEAPIDQYERKNKKATWSCLWIIWFVYVFWHQSWIILKEIVLQTCAIHLFT